jgi:hypothetical protein
MNNPEPKSSISVYEDVSVEYALCDILGSDSMYEAGYTLNFTCISDEYVIALVSSVRSQDRISDYTSSLNDVFIYSNRDDMESSVNELVEKKLTVLYENSFDSNSAGEFIELPVKRIPRSQYRIYVPQLPENLFEDVIILRAQFHGTSVEKQRHKWSVKVQSSMQKSDSYCYWIADRSMKLKNVRFDASSMSSDKEFVFKSFLPSYLDMKNCQGNVFEIDYNGDIVKGHGVLLLWRDKQF